jgi:hypothetical protein
MNDHAGQPDDVALECADEIVERLTAAGGLVDDWWSVNVGDVVP